MPTVEQLRTRLIEKLKELFQLDQPDLDFGFFRIMHAKAKQITEFLETDLLSIIVEAFGSIDESKKALLKKAYEDAIEMARKYGAPDPEQTDAVREAREKYEAAGKTASTEAEVYDHLFRFFERYYDNGDFISLRYYSRETSEKAAPFAIPYSGEEVKLHWANADQYYIKTSEYFTNFTFDLSQSRDVQDFFRGRTDVSLIKRPRRVHFHIVDATEGEHGNVKATEQTRRYFIIHKEDPVGLDENGELLVRFEYRPDPEKGSTQENTWREHRNAEAVQVILKALESLWAKEYLALLKILVPTDKQKDRILLAKYINKYTARNTFDYFIHKDLGGFLRRELDFFIKNEVMRIDDIEDADTPTVESYLSKIKVFRKIAHKIIDFLTQLEDFQKKLWLKKKFVLDAHYCITLGNIPEQFHAEIASNDAQFQDWVKQFGIGDERLKKEVSLIDERHSNYKQISLDFMKANKKLIVDTSFFNQRFKEKLLASFHNLDDEMAGSLLNAENAQALRLINDRFRQQVRCVYIDPPFNLETNADFMYKTNYKDSSWISLLHERIGLSHHLLTDNGLMYIRCDDHGNHLVRMLGNSIFGYNNFQYELCVQRIRKNVTGQGRISLPLANDSLFLYFKSDHSFLVNPYLKLTKEREAYWRRIDDSAGFRNPPERIIFGKQFMPYKYDAHFKYSQISIDTMIEEKRIRLKCTNCGYEHYSGNWINCEKCNTNDPVPQYLVEASDQKILDTNWMDISGYSSTTGFSTENSETLLTRALEVGSAEGDLVMDFFAGSGTTMAVAQKMKRRWIGVEIGPQFDLFIIPRLKKVFSHKSQHFTGFKYIRLESYEDCLNNLELKENLGRENAFATNKDLREDYLLHYMLDVETRGSQSLRVQFTDVGKLSSQLCRCGPVRPIVLPPSVGSDDPQCKHRIDRVRVPAGPWQLQSLLRDGPMCAFHFT